MLVLWAVAAGPAPVAVTVRASGDCPSARAISEALAILIAPGDRPRRPDLAEIEVRGTALAISLHRASGEVVGQRELAAPPGCRERAESAAVVLAAWETRLADHPAADLPLPVTPPPLESAAVTTDAPAGLTSRATLAGASTTIHAVQPSSAPASTPSRASSLASVVTAGDSAAGAPTSAGEPRGSVMELSGGLLASVDVDGAAVAATAEAAWLRAGTRFGIGSGALFVASHATTVSPGVGSWRRFGLVVDGRQRANWSTVWLEARIGLALTALAISGSSLSDNAGGTTFDPGALGGVRVGLRQGAVTPWLEIAATVWPRPQTLYVRDGGAVDLPRFEALIGGGMSFGWRR